MASLYFKIEIQSSWQIVGAHGRIWYSVNPGIYVVHNINETDDATLLIRQTTKDALTRSSLAILEKDDGTWSVIKDRYGDGNYNFAPLDKDLVWLKLSSKPLVPV